MNLLKAIGRTTLSLVKWLSIMTLIIGGFVGFIFASQIPSVVDMAGYIIIGALLIILLFLIILMIVMETKENYEKYARKSIPTEKSYKIDYNIVYERNRIITGKTKKQAIENLYNRESEVQTDIDCSYKITKVREIK